MKKSKYLLTIIISFLIFNFTVNAASASLSVSKSSVETGGSVTATVTVKNTAAWHIYINASGATRCNNGQFAGNTENGRNTTKSFSITCTGNTIGVISFSMSGDITDENTTNVKINGSKTVNVTKPRDKSTNNKLSKLSVEGFEISPEFKSGTNEYSVTVPATTTNVKIIATKADQYSSVEGDGDKEVTDGSNNFDIVVTSETGVSNTYKLVVNVIDNNPIKVKVDGKEYTVVKVAKNLVKPELFEEKTIKIDDLDIPAFYNDIVKYTLVGLKDSKGNISLFIYNKGKYTKYIEQLSNRVTIVFLNNKKLKGYKETTMKINEIDTKVLKNSNSIIIYGVNLETGKENYYSYDKLEKTLQIFNSKKYLKDLKETKQNEYLIYILSGICLLAIILVILLLSKNKNTKKLMK